MTSISSLTSGSVSSYASTSQVRSATDADGDGDGDSGRVHHGHRGTPPGGGMGQELVAALQSLGLNVSGLSNANSANNTSTSSSSSDSSTSATGSTASSLRKDMHEFMHQLFDAARQAESSSSTSASSTSTDPSKGGFAQGLAALLSQISSGSTPSGLQSAFDKLKTDLGTSGASGSTDATLQTLLTKLQGSLGYSGATAGTTATASIPGTLINSVA